jgi:WD40 repeat protein
VEAVAWSPDGNTLATGSWDRTIRLWDPHTGHTTNKLTGHAGSVEAVAWSPDGRILATGGQDGIVRLWNPENGEAIATYESLGDSWASWDAAGDLVACDENAWEHLAWYVPGDSDHPYGRALPAEFFGPLPVAAPGSAARRAGLGRAAAGDPPPANALTYR